MGRSGKLFDVAAKRVRTEKLLTIGRMASPHRYLHDRRTV
jgi:hypothetical protein